jgi:predicted NAD/FAD-dependent oxidoreductase
MKNSKRGGKAIAIIGAGMSGLTLAAQLQETHHHVVVFDKSKGPGGRCATRRNQAGWFDHGVPWVQATTAQFTEQLHEWQRAGVLASIGENQTWVGQPFMNAWMRHLARGLTIKTSTHIAAIERHADAWRLRALEGPDLKPSPDELFDAVVVATPAEQASPLLAHCSSLAHVLRQTRSSPCWTVMACWPNPLPIQQSVLRNDDLLAPLAIAVCQDGLPGRATAPDAPHDGGGRWVLHAGSQWSAQNLDATADAVTQRLLTALADTAGCRLARPSWSSAHRWRYAQVASPQTEPYGWDADLRLGACGDAWHGQSHGALGLERAWLSAVALARHIQTM